MLAPQDDPQTAARCGLLEHMAGRYRTCNPTQLAAIDAEAVSQLGMSLAGLIDRAGNALAIEARLIAEELEPPVEVLVLAGKGHNGADGLAAARALHANGSAVTVYLFASEAMLDGPTKLHLERAQAAGVLVMQPAVRAMDAAGGPAIDVHTEIFEHLHTQLARCAIESGPEARSCIVIDALVGTSLSRPLEGPMFQAVMRVNAARNARLSTTRMHVLAADIPSGLSSESGFIGPCMHADSTLTFVACKPAFRLSDVRMVTGPIRLADLGIPAELIDHVLQRA